jgi:hypothetical protein
MWETMLRWNDILNSYNPSWIPPSSLELRLLFIAIGLVGGVLLGHALDKDNNGGE